MIKQLERSLYVSIGSKLRKRRIDLCLSAAELAQACGLAKATVFAIETQGRGSLEAIHKLAASLNTTLGQLLTDEEIRMFEKSVIYRSQLGELIKESPEAFCEMHMALSKARSR